MRGCLGLSVGTTNLVAVAQTAPIVRPAVLSLGPGRRPEVGGPAGDGLIISGFVERVGDPVPLIAADGSAHRAENLLAEAVDAMTRAAGVARPDAMVLAVPAHWHPGACDAVRRVLPTARVVSDAVAALTAIRAHPGLPARGVVALCDFGATGTSLTLADAGAGFAPIGPTVRYDDFSGDLIDQELLRQVLATLDDEPSGTAAVATLAQLREQCRIAKERLSAQGSVALPGPSGRALRLTRAEVDTVVGEPLRGLTEALLDLLRRNGIHPASLAALVTVGGGARIPLVTQRLSEALRMPVSTVPQAQVIAAVGASLLAHRREDEPATRAVAPVSRTATVAAVAPAAVAPAAVAWSLADDARDVVEYIPDAVAEDAARPQFVFTEPGPEAAAVAAPPWYRRGGVLVYAAAFLAVVGTTGLVISARADSRDAASVTAAAPRPAESPLAQTGVAPPTRTVIVQNPVPVAQAEPRPQSRPAAAPRVVQRQQAAPPAAPRPAPVPAAPRPLPPPAVPVAVPVPQFPVPQLPLPPVVLPPITLPQLPIPTFVPPTSTAPEPTKAPEPEPTQAPEPTKAPEPEPTHAPEPTTAPTVQPEPAPATSAAPTTSTAPPP